MRLCTWKKWNLNGAECVVQENIHTNTINRKLEGKAKRTAISWVRGVGWGFQTQKPFMGGYGFFFGATKKCSPCMNALIFDYKMPEYLLTEGISWATTFWNVKQPIWRFILWNLTVCIHVPEELSQIVSCSLSPVMPQLQSCTWLCLQNGWHPLWCPQIHITSWFLL